MIRATTRAGLLVSITLLAFPIQALAHSPTPGSNASWAGKVNDGPSYFKWDSTVPTWLKAPMESVLESNWADSATNNSDSIRFQHASGGSATVWFVPRYEEGVPSECQAVNWQGCANGAGSWSWNIWIRSTSYVWCQNNPNNLDCRDVERVAIHEAGHVGGFLGHNDGSQTNTVMQSDGAPLKPSTGWDTDKLRRCDTARMQILYGEASLSGPYAECFDHVANACPAADPDGMCTDLSASPVSTTVCSGTPVTLSGRLDISSNHYGRLKGNGTYELDANSLAGRTVTIKRNGFSYTTSTASSASGNNWSKVITQTVPVTTTYNFTAQFVRPTTPTAMETGLASSAVRSFSITVVEPADC